MVMMRTTELVVAFADPTKENNTHQVPNFENRWLVNDWINSIIISVIEIYLTLTTA
jgi:hypothetical protein